MKKHIGAALSTAIVSAVLIGLAACGGGGTTSPGAGTPITMQGAMTEGSVILGGVRFDDSAASISADESAKTPAYLKNGMMVKLKGRVNDDRVTGRAEAIEAENEIRGPVGSVGTDSFIVLGQTVHVDGTTFLDGGISFFGGVIGGLAPGDRVEVHGPRSSTGEIAATRVEKLGPGTDDEVRGTVTAKTPLTNFEIEGAAVYDYDSATIIEGGADFSVGDLVEVHLSGTYATRIELEDAEDARFKPAQGAEIEIEGFVRGYAGPGDNTFLVGGQPIEIGPGTRFEGGVIDDLADDVRVEAEGRATAGGAIAADKIQFKETIRIEANADKNGEPDALGLEILVTGLTDDRVSGGIGSIVIGDGLKIRGYLNNDGLAITATRVDDTGSLGPNDIVLQGPAANPSGTAYTYTVAGITVDYGAASEIEDEDGEGSAVLTRDQFRAKISGRLTVVKAKGSFTPGTPGTFTAREVEIE